MFEGDEDSESNTFHDFHDNDEDEANMEEYDEDGDEDEADMEKYDEDDCEEDEAVLLKLIRCTFCHLILYKRSLTCSRRCMERHPFK